MFTILSLKCLQAYMYTIAKTNIGLNCLFEFLPRDAYAQRVLCRRKMFDRLSVSLSHADVLWTSLNISSKFFLFSGNLATLVFPHQTGWQYSDGNPSNGGVECKGDIKNHDFRPISRFNLETMQDTDIVTINGKNLTV